MSELKAPPNWPGAASGPEKGFPDWRNLLKSVEASGSSGQRVLIASHTGLHGAVVALDSTLAAALKVRGVEVHYSLCDGILQGCLMATIGDATPPESLINRNLQKTHCKGCFNRGTSVYRGLDAHEHRLSQLLTTEDYTYAAQWAAQYNALNAGAALIDEIPVGEHALAGALRYFASGDLTREPQGEAVLQRYLEGGALMYRAFTRLLEQTQPDVVVLHHGIYSPQGIASQIAAKMGVRVVTWVVAYRKNSFIFSHDDTYHHTLMDEPVTEWDQLALSDQHKDELRGYLESRSGGKEDWVYFHKDPDSSFKAYAKQVDIDLEKPIVSLLTNVMWDAQLHYPQNAFSSMKEWIFDSIRLLGGRRDVEVVIRIHPAEARGSVPARQTLLGEINREFPELAQNIHVVAPLDDVSTYELAAISNAVIIFGTKMGVELTPMGRPVIVAGEAWIRNKGLTIDVSSRDQYEKILSSLPLNEADASPDAERAMKYAYHFFFRRMIPLPFVVPSDTSAFFSIDVKTGEELKAGNWPGLDVICDGILEGTPFVYPAEVLN